MRKINKIKDDFLVYIVQCKYGTYYTGSTGDLKKRIALHNSGKGAKYLRGKGPVKLVYSKVCGSHQAALVMERKIKQMRKKEKIELVQESA